MACMALRREAASLCRQASNDGPIDRVLTHGIQGRTVLAGQRHGSVSSPKHLLQCSHAQHHDQSSALWVRVGLFSLEHFIA